MYVSLARWLAINLITWAIENMDDLVLGASTIYEPDFLLGSLLEAELDGQLVWDLIWDKCLKGKKEVIAGCASQPEDCEWDEMREAMGCVVDILKPAFRELPIQTWTEFSERAQRAIEKLREKFGDEE